MTEKIISTFTTSKNDTFRIRELGFIESLSAGGKFIIEVLEQGTFRQIQEPYFKTLEAAKDVINRIYNLDQLLIRKRKAITKLSDSFEESIKGTNEHEFYQILDGLWLDDFDIKLNDHSRALVSTGDINANVIAFLRKNGLPTTFREIYIVDYLEHYDVILHGYDREHSIFNTIWLEHEKAGGVQYRLLFERYLSVTFRKFF